MSRRGLPSWTSTSRRSTHAPALPARRRSLKLLAIFEPREGRLQLLATNFTTARFGGPSRSPGRPADRSSRDAMIAPTSTASSARDPPRPRNALRGAHAVECAVGVRALHPAAESVVVQPPGSRWRACNPGGVLRGHIAGATLPLDYEAGDPLPRRQTFTRPPNLTASLRPPELDEHLFRLVPPLALGPKMGGARARDRRRLRHVVRRPVRRPRAREPRRLLQLLGTGVCNINAPGARAARRPSGSSSFRHRRGRRLQSSRSHAVPGELLLKPTRSRFRPSCRRNDGGDRPTAGHTSGARTITPRAPRPASAAGPARFGLRGAPRLVALTRIEDNRSLTYLELADDWPAYVPTSASRTSSSCRSWGTLVQGSWGYQVTSYYDRPSTGLRRARRLPRFRRPDASNGNRRPAGLVARAHSRATPGRSARFDGTWRSTGTSIRAAASPRSVALIFTTGRNEVRKLPRRQRALLARDFHSDGIRVDSVASML